MPRAAANSAAGVGPRAARWRATWRRRAGDGAGRWGRGLIGGGGAGGGGGGGGGRGGGGGDGAGRWGRVLIGGAGLGGRAVRRASRRGDGFGDVVRPRPGRGKLRNGVRRSPGNARQSGSPGRRAANSAAGFTPSHPARQTV